MFEPKVLTKVNLPSVVETNLSDLEPIIAEKIARAKSLVVTDDESDVKAADADSTELRKMGDRVGRFRREFVEWWKGPLAKVEAICKGYEKRLAAAADELRAKTQEIKDEWSAKKKEELEALLTERLNERFDDPKVLSSPHWRGWFDERTDPRTKGNWLNRTTRMSTVEAEIGEELERVENGQTAVMEALGEDGEEVVTVAMLEWVKDFSTEDALRAVYRYKTQKKAIEDARVKSAEITPSTAFAPPTGATMQGTGANAPRAEKRAIASEPIDLVTYRLSVTGSIDALWDLKRFCKANGIKVVNLDRVVE